ncbi:MAG: ABC transporter permease family protein [Anaerolineae bacterium]
MTWLRVIWKRLLSHPWLVGMYIASLALCIAVFSSPSLYADAVYQAIMRDELSKSAQAFSKPTFAIRYYAMPTKDIPMGLLESDQTRAWLAHTLASGLGLPIRSTYVHNESPIFKLLAQEGDTQYSDRNLAYTTVAVVPHIGEHLQTIMGAPYGSVESADCLDVWLLPEFADKLGLTVGERYQLSYTSNLPPVDIRIAGIVAAAEKGDEFWFWDPSILFSGSFLTTEHGYDTYLAPIVPGGFKYLFWYFVFDDSKMNLTTALRYIGVLNRTKLDVSLKLPGGQMDTAPLDALTHARDRKLSLSIVLSALTLPLMVVLLQFIAIISTIYALAGARQDAMLTSRGANRIQLFLISLAEALVCLVLALPIGLLLGVQLARLLGLANGFLSFGGSSAPRIYLSALDWQPVAIIAGASLLVRLWASGKQAGVSVVHYEHRSAGRKVVVTGLRLVMIGVLAAITVYAYRQLVAVGSVPLILKPDEVTYPDPLLLIAPCLFLLAVSLLVAESTSWLIGVIVSLSEPILPAAALVVLRQMSREKTRTRSPIFLMVISLALGVFYASLAYSSQLWLDDHLRHIVGADISLEQAVVDTGPSFRPPTGDFSKPIIAGEGSWLLPDADYEQADGVNRATQVADYWAQARFAGRESNIRLIGIDRFSFPAVATIRSDYSAEPFGELMNRLAVQPLGALVPRSAAAEYKLAIGDHIPVKYTYEKVPYDLDYVIVGFYDYFPTVNEKEIAVVVNSASIFEGVGQMLPHSIWLKTNPGANPDTILQKLEGQGMVVKQVLVLEKILASETGSREYVGILGMMSVSFLASLTAAFAGALVLLFANLARQRLTLALLHGIGLSLKSITSSVLLEYVVIVVFGISWGAFVGSSAAGLYGKYYPLIAASDNIVPAYLAHNDGRIAWWLISVMVVISICIVILVGIYLKRQRLFEHLRMGQNE